MENVTQWLTADMVINDLYDMTLKGLYTQVKVIHFGTSRFFIFDILFM